MDRSRGLVKRQQLTSSPTCTAEGFVGGTFIFDRTVGKVRNQVKVELLHLGKFIFLQKQWAATDRGGKGRVVARNVRSVRWTVSANGGELVLEGDFEAYNPAGKVISTSRRRVYPGFASFQRVGGTPKAFETRTSARLPQKQQASKAGAASGTPKPIDPSDLQVLAREMARLSSHQVYGRDIAALQRLTAGAGVGHSSMPAFTVGAGEERREFLIKAMLPDASS
eukprot:INCI15784.2.p1 GENE.INCI15784.2~~INCI15784.2.p1  ORF type:complete len:224 (-),score=24.94 INCI15784.2:208-879(-)